MATILSAIPGGMFRIAPLKLLRQSELTAIPLSYGHSRRNMRHGAQYSSHAGRGTGHTVYAEVRLCYRRRRCISRDLASMIGGWFHSISSDLV